mgnify:CR=1 FL=1
MYDPVSELAAEHGNHLNKGVFAQLVNFTHVVLSVFKCCVDEVNLPLLVELSSAEVLFVEIQGELFK